MIIEKLRMDNLRDGVYCAKGMQFGDEWYRNLEVWLDGGLLRGQIARDDTGEPIGFVLYYPIEHVPMEVGGEGLYMVQCLQVKPPHDKTGIARKLIESAIADARNCGAAGIVAEGLAEAEQSDIHEHVTAEFLESLGLIKGQSRRFATLYYMTFRPDAQEPSYLPTRFAAPASKATIRVDILDCSLCYVGIHNRETVLQAVERSARERVEVFVHDQNNRGAVVDKGLSSGVFVDGKLTFFRGPINEADVLEAIDVADSARRQAMDK